jgi:hypothetical protein
MSIYREKKLATESKLQDAWWKIGGAAYGGWEEEEGGEGF